MNNRNIHQVENPRLKANFCSKLFFCWVIPYIFYGSKRNLETKDPFQLAPENRNKILGDKLQKCWNDEINDAKEKKRRPCLWNAIRKVFGYSYLKFLIPTCSTPFIAMVFPIVTRSLLFYFEENSTTTMLQAFLYASLIMVLVILEALLLYHSHFSMTYIGAQVKSSCSAIIYRKILRLPINTENPLDRGKIINLLSNDVAQFEEVFIYIHEVVLIPLLFIIYGILMWRNLGITPTLLIIIVIVQHIPFEVFSVLSITKLRGKAAQKTDDRLLLMNEIIHGIRVIKMYTWEKPMEQLILLIRRKELDFIAKKLYFIISRTLFKTHQCVSLYLIIIVLILCGVDVTSVIIFPLIQYNFYLNVYAGHELCSALNKLADAKAAVKRIEDFSMMEEITTASILCSSNNNVVVDVKNVTVSWSEKAGQEILKNISISIASCRLYALVGEIGSGKSTLIHVILGELNPKSGRVLNYRKMSFASQEPWLFNGSIRSNILLGEPFVEEKYNQVVSSCALLKDFEQLPHGDKTIIGEESATLSGGQTARINLARAVYKNADIYLLDDPMASIDFCVGKCIFDNCINGMLKNKARILVTQKLEYIKEADEIIYINDGQIQYQGDYENFQKHRFYSQLLRNQEFFNDSSLTDNHKKSQDSICSFVSMDAEEDEAPEANEVEDLLSEYNEINAQIKSYRDPDENIETIKQGSISLSILKHFYNNKVLVAFVLLCIVSTQSFISGFDYLVAMWARKQDKYVARLNSTIPSNTTSNFVDSQLSLLYIISAVVIGMVILSIIELILFVQMHRQSCETLHKRMITRLLGATVQFFDINGSGRILNRLSQDLGVVDEQMPIMVMKLVKSLIHVLIVFSQVLLVYPYMCVPVTISICLVSGTIIFTKKTIRSIKRLEARAKSSVLAHISTSFIGRITIRASGAESMVHKNFTDYQDNYMAASFTYIHVSSAYYLWIEIILLSLKAILPAVLIPFKSSSVPSATVGYILTQMFLISRIIIIVAKYSIIYDTLMVSTERSFEYTELELENDEDKCKSNTPSSWPTNGKIKFDHLYLTHSTSVEPTLKDINIAIEHGSKIGVIGRTGAGKSSLATALFRLTETEGSLFVDGVDIKTVALKDLRSKISILPQKPVLFSTTLRKNLDPLELFDDAKLWSALKSVKLDHIFQSLDQQLDKQSLILNHRQLLCIARAILKRNKILILDEATASTDSYTEDLIQSTVKQNFEGCTVITIAHKLNSVMNCDKILVVDDGRIIEFDEPSTLLQQKNSYFYKMWQAVIKYK